MGSLGKVFSSAVKIGSFGLLDVSGKKPTVGTGSMQEELKTEAEDTLKRRRALYATEKGELGEEVDSTLQKKRGNIFGNY